MVRVHGGRPEGGRNGFGSMFVRSLRNIWDHYFLQKIVVQYGGTETNNGSVFQVHQPLLIVCLFV